MLYQRQAHTASVKSTGSGQKRSAVNPAGFWKMITLVSSLSCRATRWDASRIKLQLAGKPAPPLALVDINGNPVSLVAFKGKTVLLDFWTTWCPPCRDDGPALEKLNQKYGNKELAILGVSVDEERKVVAKFLKENPKTYPIVLTLENDMPRPYQIGVFPTYIVIDHDGNVASAVQGDKGFSELRTLLRKAGMEAE
jgi:thiol-disulfide isomerase/thioredoxin